MPQDGGHARRRFLLLIAVLFAAFVLAPVFAAASPAKAYVIASGSMEPSIPTGSIVFTGPGEPRVGDVVVYNSRAGVPQVHRIIEVNETTAGERYVLRGDANDADDSFLVARDEIAGHVRGHLPFVGWLWLMPPALHFGLFGAAAVGYVLLTLWESRRVSGRAAKVAAVSMVLVLLAPAAAAGVTVRYPDSPPTAAVFADSPLPFSAGSMGDASITGDENNASVSVGAPKLWKEIVMWGCHPRISGEEGCVIDDAGSSYSAHTGSMTLVDATRYPGATFRLEAYMRASGASDTVSVELYHRSSTVSGSEVTVTGSAKQWAVSDGFTLSGNEVYTFRYKTSSPTSEEIHMVKLVAAQEFPTATETVLRVSGAGQAPSGDWTNATRTARFTYDGSGFDGTTVTYFEAIGQVGASGTPPQGEVRLYDETAGSSVTGSVLLFSSTSTTRLRSSDLAANLVDGNTYRVQFRYTDGLVSPWFDMHMARLIIQQTDAFTKTVRYVDLAGENSTTSSSYVGAGYDGRYRMDTEWGDRTAYLDASLLDTAPGVEAGVRLFDHDAGAAVAGSTVTSGAETWTHVRSDPFTLSTANTTYGVQAASLNGGDSSKVYIHHAWLVVYQDTGKTFDHVLVTTNDHNPACTWDFTLRLDGSTGLARLDNATVTIRDDTVSTLQVAIDNGVATVTEGSAVTLSATEQLEYVVATNPNAAGSSELFLRLLGTCQGNGIHTIQDIVLTLG